MSDAPNEDFSSEDAMIKQHKFQIGQQLHYKPAGAFGRMQMSGEVKIERLLPPTATENQYQVDSLFDGRKRVVRESEIG
ncbi:MAG: hypothetical protein JO128_14755 [Alphaproteobacteria bacterium]|nr:hypothetical protein [Alphaproteobacteria bacterium]